MTIPIIFGLPEEALFTAHHFKQHYKPPVISPINCTSNLDNSPIRFSNLVRRFPTNELAIFSFHPYAFAYKMGFLEYLK